MDTFGRLGTYWATLIGSYFLSKGLYQTFGFDDVYKTALQEQIAFQSLLVFGLLIFITTQYYASFLLFSSSNNYITNWIYYIGLSVGILIPAIQYSTAGSSFMQWVILLILLFGFLYNLTKSPSIYTSLIYAIGIILMFYITLVLLPRSKRAETVEITKSGDVQQGATIAILGPQLNPGSPIFYAILAMLIAPVNTDLGILISSIFLGAFVGSTALYGSSWLYSDKTVIKPEKCMGLDSKTLLDISTNQDISSIRWTIGLLVLLQIFMFVMVLR